MTKTAANYREIDNRRSLVEQADKIGATMNGEPCRVSGVYNKFATIWTESNKVGFEFSWATVKHVMEGSGKFKA